MNFISTTNTVNRFNTPPISPQTIDIQNITRVIEGMQGNLEQLHAALMYLCGDKKQTGIEKFIAAVEIEHSHLAERFMDDPENYKTASRELFQKIGACLCHHLPQSEQQEILHAINKLTACINDDDVEVAKMAILKQLSERELGGGEFSTAFQISKLQNELNDASELSSRQMVNSGAGGTVYRTNDLFGLPIKNNLNNNFILLHNHCDIGLINLIGRNAKWVMDTFDAIYVECSPRHFDRNQILNFLFAGYLNKAVDVRSVTNLYDVFTKDEVDALMFCIPEGQDYSGNPVLYDKILKDKLTGLEKVCGPRQASNQYNAGDQLIQILFGLKLALFYKTCTENTNIKLIGAEPEDYRPGSTSLLSRDKSMGHSLIENDCRSRNTLFIVGAVHGINLMTDLCSSGRGGFHFVRLTSDKSTYSSQALFSQWCDANQQKNSGYSVRQGYGSSFQKKLINESDKELQDQEFKSLYKPFKGLIPIPHVSQNGGEVHPEPL